ncbi:hypothetical protein AgCh_013117 [Apium graveolens]
MARLQQTQRKRVGSAPRLPDDVVAAIAAEKIEKEVHNSNYQHNITEQTSSNSRICILTQRDLIRIDNFLVDMQLVPSVDAARDRVAMFELETYAGIVQKAALIENNGMQSRTERDNKKRKVPFYGEKSEAGSSQDRNVKRIGFQKGGNFQKKGNLGKRQESKGNN